MKLDADGRQELALAKLEGLSHRDAMARAAAARDFVARRRQLNIGERAVQLADFTARVEEGMEPVTLDTRTREERERIWDLIERVPQLLSYCTNKQRRVLETRFGLVDGIPRTLQETADLLGQRWFSVVAEHEKAGLERIRRGLAREEKEKDLTPEELEYRAGRRQRQAEAQRRRRARLAAEQ